MYLTFLMTFQRRVWEPGKVQTSLFCRGVSLQQTTASQAIPTDLSNSGQFRNVAVMLTPSIINPYCLYGSSFIFRLEDIVYTKLI